MFLENVLRCTSVEESDERIRSHAANIMSRFNWADRAMLHRKFYFALRHAAETYNPDFGLGLAEYEGMCLMNCRHHTLRQLASEAKRRGMTMSLDAKVAGDDGRCVYGDLLADSRNTVRRQRQVLALREFFSRLRGNDWSVCVAALAGYNRSEIARHLGVPRSSFDRVFGPVLDQLKEAAEGV